MPWVSVDRTVCIMSNEFVYPLTTSYVDDWTVERAVAELVANALDEDARAKIERVDACTRITDRGGGWPEEALVFGYSNKTESQIGQFGEGAKVAMLVLARELGDDAVTVETVGYTLRARIEERHLGVMAGQALKLLVLRIEPNRRRRGTVVTIGCDAATHDRVLCRFLQLSRPGYRRPVGVGRVLPGEAGRLYVGGVLIAEGRDLLFGYDFPLAEAKRLQNRDRSVIDGWELMRLIRDSIGACADPDVATRIARAVLDGSLPHSERNLPSTLGLGKTKRAWREAARRVRPAPRCFYATGEAGNDPRIGLLEDSGWVRLTSTSERETFATVMQALNIPSVSEASRTRVSPTTWVKRADLTDDERSALTGAKRAVRRVWPTLDLTAVRVYSHRADSDSCAGFYDPVSGTIGLRRSTLRSVETATSTLVHELAHREAHREGGEYQDRTRGFESMLTSMCADAVLHRRGRSRAAGA